MVNPFKAMGDLNNFRKEAKKIQDALAAEEIVVEEGDIMVVISGDQKIKQFSVKGISSKDAIKVLNKAIQQSQQVAAKKVNSLTGGLGGLMRGMKQ